MKNNQQDAQRKLFEAHTLSLYGIKPEWDENRLYGAFQEEWVGFQAGYNACLEANNIIVLDEGAEPEVGDVLEIKFGDDNITATEAQYLTDKGIYSNLHECFLKPSGELFKSIRIIQRQGKPVIYNKKDGHA